MVFRLVQVLDVVSQKTTFPIKWGLIYRTPVPT